MEKPPTEDPIAGIYVYSDGSCDALEKEKWNMDRLVRAETKLSTLRAFLEKHREKLAGSSWDIHLFDIHDAPMRVSWTTYLLSYRGVYMNPVEFIQAVWPDLEWKRVKHCNYSDEHRDYVAELEGVELRIERAEYSQTVKVSRHKPNGRLRIPKTPSPATP